MVKFSLMHYPERPVQESLDIMQTAEELDFYACYFTDWIFMKDPWPLFGIAADRTKRIRLGPDATHVILKEPTHIAQALATLDELSDGRVDAVIALGGPMMLRRYHVHLKAAWSPDRLKEALQVIRTFLDEGKIDFEGQYFKYTDLWTSARPVQEHLPLKVATLGGPKAMEVAGEVADGMHISGAASRQTCEYAIGHVKIGAERAGRNWEELDLGAVPILICSEDSKAAKALARIIAASYVPALPKKLVEPNDISYESLQPIREAWARGEAAKAIELTTPELAEVICIAGAPEECVEKIRTNILPTGINHVVAAMFDSFYAKVMTGKTIDGVPDIKGQLRLIHDRIMPALR